MYIVFDIGGTQMRLAGSEDGESLSESVSISTPQDPQEGAEQFAELAQDIAEGREIEAIAGGIAGPLDDSRSKLIKSPNLSNWVGFEFKEELQKQCGVDEVYLENDTAMVGLGEAVDGAGEMDGITAYITISTGAGGARIVNGEIDKASVGFEPGHQIINIEEFDEGREEGEITEGQVPGHWEFYVSGSNMERRYGEHPAKIEDPKKWDKLEHELVVGLNNICVLWSPDVIVLGGAMIVKKTGIVIERVRERLDDVLTIFPEIPEIRKAEFIDNGGLHGALEYIQQQ